MPQDDGFIEPSTDENASGGGSSSEFQHLEYSLDSASLHQSLGSAIYKHSFERGRRYHYFRNGKYPIPNDDLEQNREDMKHALILEVTDGQLIHAPIGGYPQKIIDIGTGTGIWAIEVGDKYPSAEVIGVDLSPIQPVWLPPNVRFIIDDIEDEWLGTGMYDLVHARHVSQVVHSFAKVLKHCYANLKPGGWIETGDFDGAVHCDDGTMPADWPVKVFWEKLTVAMGLLSHDFAIAARLGSVLEAAGFVNVTQKVVKVPIGTWPADKTLRLAGMYMRQITQDFLGAAANKPYKVLGLSDEDIAAFMATVTVALRKKSAHIYTRYYIWCAQKPANARV